jgi:hypothetical protein
MKFMLGFCNGRVRYANFEIAGLVARKIAKVKGEKAKPYKCDECGSYHYLLQQVEEIEESPVDSTSQV